MKALEHRFGTETVRDVMYVAIARALDTGVSATDVGTLTGYTDQQVERFGAVGRNRPSS